MIRLGLMGCGVVATYGHIPAIQRTKGLELKSIFEPDSARLIETRSHFGIPNGFTDADLFFQSGIDAVIVTSPAPAHLDNVLMAARYRKPVLCEKPLATSEAESQRMIDVMREASLPLYVGFTYRFGQPAARIKQLIAENAIGQVRSLRLIYVWDCHGKFSPRDSDMLNPYRTGRMREGGPMVDCGVHQIDLARWWLGSDIVNAHGVGAWVDREFESPDHMYLHLDHASGAHTMVEMSYSYAHTSSEQRSHFFYELIGADGLIKYDRQARLFELVNKQGARDLGWHYEKNFEGMYQCFEQALRTGDAGDMPTAHDGLAVTRLATRATEQAIRNRPQPA